MKKSFIEIECYDINNNDSYLCIINSRLNIYDMNSLMLVCSFSDMNNYTYAEFINKKTIIAKNMEGMFKIYDMDKEKCVETIKLDQIRNYAQGTQFALSSKHACVYDIMTVSPFIDERFYKINILSKKIECVRMAENLGAIHNVSYNNNERKIYLLNVKAVGKIDGEHKVLNEIIEIDDIKMTYKVVYSCLTNLEKNAILFFDFRYIINEKMEIIDICTGSIIKMIDYEFHRGQYGYFKKAYLYFSNTYLILVHSRKVVVINMENSSIVYEYNGECNCAVFINNDLFIGSYDNVIIVKDPLKLGSAKGL